MDLTAVQMLEAARAWLDGLDPAQRAAAVSPGPAGSLSPESLSPAESERRRWFYTPTDHGGLDLHRMRPAQQQQAMRLLATGLSRPGYVTAATIMGLENVLDQSDDWGVGWGRERGRDPQLYWLKVFGEPTPQGPWSWRFGGHHVSVQHLVLDGRVQSSTPCFFGADPATSPLLGGHLLRPLGAAEDLARDLLDSLDETQLAEAVLSPVAPLDIVSGNRPSITEGDRPLPLPAIWRELTDPGLRELAESIQQKAETRAGVRAQHHDAVSLTTTPKGVPASHLSGAQQELLHALLDVFLDRVPAELAARHTPATLDDVHFAWAGDTRRGHPHYYRLQGPRLLAEYDNTSRDANHIHTVWRDPTNDFGDDVLARHRAQFHR